MPPAKPTISELRRGVVRVLDADGKTAGAGFCAGADLIATCSHVVVPRNRQGPGVKPPREVALEFFGNVPGRAELCEDTWRPADAEDVVLLRVRDGIPASVPILRIGTSAGCEGHRFRTFGFPAVEGLEGLPDEGTLVGTTTKKGTRVSLWKLETDTVTGGFSGAPVFDLKRQRVVAMIVATLDRDPRGRLGGALAVPAEVIQPLSSEVELSDTRPYLGLKAFAERDAQVFHGRQRDVTRLFERIRSSPRFLAVLGPSGSGKSSIVHAGLIPLIRTRPETRGWAIAAVRGSSPELSAALAEARGTPAGRRLLFVIDQFEEVFTELSHALRSDALGRLVDVLRSSAPVTSVILMRDDFYSRLPQESPDLAAWLDNGVANVLPRLGRGEILEIINGPAESLGVPLETGLAERIADDAIRFDPVADVEGPSARITVLPLLEFALDSLFDDRVDGMLVNRAYPPGGVTSILAHWARDTFQGLLESERPRARRLFTELVHVGDESQSVPFTRRRRKVRELWGAESDRTDTERLLKVFTDARLLVTERVGSEVTVEIIHESLIQTWDDLQRWVGERRGFLLWRAAVAARVARWVRTGEDDSLLRRSELAEIRANFAGEMDEEEQRFVEASRVAERTRAELEEERRIESESRELAAAAFSQLHNDAELSVLLASEAVARTATPQAWDALHAAVESSRVRKTLIPPSRAASLSVNRDGHLLTVGCADGAARIWHVTEEAWLAELPGHAREVTSVVFDQPETMLATASLDGTVRLWSWNGRAASFVRQWKAHEGGVHSVAFSPDGQLLATGGVDTDVRLWDLRNLTTSVPAHRLEGSRRLIYSVAFDAQGTRVAAGCADNVARVWDLASRRLVLATPPARDRVSGVCFSEDGTRLAAASYDSRARIYRLDEPETAPVVLSGASNWLLGIAFDPEGTRVAACGADFIARVWEAASGRLIVTLRGHKERVTAVAFQADPRTVVTASVDGTVRFWETSEVADHLTVTSHDEVVYAGEFDPAGKLVCTVSERTVKTWHLETFEEVGSYAGTAAVLSPDGTEIAIVHDGKIQIRNVRTGKITRAFPGHPGSTIDIVWRPDGKQIATGGDDDKAALWNLDDPGEPIVLSHHSDWVNGLAYSRNGARLATTSDDRTVRIWNTTNGAEIVTLEGHSDWVNGVCFDTTGGRLATASHDRTVRFWDLAHPGEALVFEGHTDVVRDVDLNPNDTLLATASKDCTVRIWSVGSRRALHVIRGHADEVWRVTFSPRGTTLLSCSWDRTARLWDVATGAEIGVLRSVESPAQSVPFSPDGIARLYRIALADLLVIAAKRKTRALTDWERRQFLHEESPSTGPGQRRIDK